METHTWRASHIYSSAQEFLWINLTVKNWELQSLGSLFKHSPPEGCIVRGRNSILKQFLKTGLEAHVNMLRRSSGTLHGPNHGFLHLSFPGPL